MSEQRISMSSLAKELEVASGDDFKNILRVIASPAYVDEALLKSDLGILNAKIVKLLRSSNDYECWKGCHAAAVVCSYNPLFLLSYGGQSLSAIYAKLEQKTNYYSTTTHTSQGRALLSTLVSTTDLLMDLMRNKPTLSRECLVPKLKAIIPTLIQLARYEPQQCLPILKKLLFKHSTTFKPFVNKYRVALVQTMTNNYHFLSKDIQQLLCSNYAYLHLIKLQSQHTADENEAHHKAYDDDTWRAGIYSILIQFKPIIKLCDNILDFDQDKELSRLFDTLPSESYKDYKIEEFLSPLKLDMNKPFTLWELPRRVNMLVDLLTAFVTQPTPFPIRVPIGSINFICESLVSLTTKYLPLKRELRRDQDLNTVIGDVLPQMQFAGIRLWKNMISAYGIAFLPMADRVLGSLEIFIPFKPKTNIVDIDACHKLKKEFLTVFEVANLIMQNLGHRLNEVDPILKLVDVALSLSEDKSLIENIFNNKPIKKDGANTQNKQKTKQKKDNKAAAITDLYTNYDQFVTKKSVQWFNEINKFLLFIISNWRRSPAQQIHTIKYTISRSLQFKEKTGSIPDSFVELLRILVINPGNERLSILPIAVSVLKECSDEYFDLLCHPRLPLSIIHNVRKSAVLEDEEDAEDGNIDGAFSGNAQAKTFTSAELGGFNALEPISTETDAAQIAEPVDAPSAADENDSKIFKKRSADDVEVDAEITLQSAKKSKVQMDEMTKQEIRHEQIIADRVVEERLEPVVAKVEKEEKQDSDAEHNEDEDDNSEFEIPDIHLSEYEDDEDAESDS